MLKKKYLKITNSEAYLIKFQNFKGKTSRFLDYSRNVIIIHTFNKKNLLKSVVLKNETFQEENAALLSVFPKQERGIQGQKHGSPVKSRFCQAWLPLLDALESHGWSRELRHTFCIVE